MNERERAITNLMAVDLSGGSHEMLSSIAKAIYKPTCGGWTIGACEKLRQTLVRLLGEADAAPSGGRITDELRTYIDGLMLMPTRLSNLIAIADRIDAEHEEALSKVYMDMSDSEWVRLPKDADGKPIHIGDKLVDKNDKLSKPAIVKCILYNDEGCVVSDIDPQGYWYNPSFLRHYHAPTVEDVLRDFICDHEEGVRDEVDLIDEYAAKLRLAGSDVE